LYVQGFGAVAYFEKQNTDWVGRYIEHLFILIYEHRILQDLRFIHAENTTFTYTCMYAFMFTCSPSHMHVCIYFFAYVYMCKCTYMYCI